MGADDAFNLSQLRRALIGTRFGKDLHHFPSVDSTNTLLLKAAAAGAEEGTVYLADEQTAGRGRADHAWQSNAGDGLYVSALVKPAVRLEDALWLSLASGLAARSAIASVAGISIDIRWPNDLLVRKQKVGGILVETAVNPDADATLRYAVIGIGINVHQRQFPGALHGLATSLHLSSGDAGSNSLSRAALLIELLRALDAELLQLEAAQPEAVHSSLLQRFAAASSWVRGKRVTVAEDGGYSGVTAGLDGRGYLLVQAEDGTRRTVLSGGVREALVD